MANAPAKADIDAIFNRLRSTPTNKCCFDCGAKNPSWSSVTYGVFICIDCSAVHRSLGVHLTFVRSTNLDTNWTWIQIRQMQVGGNANAAQFFRQHNCNTTDAQQKYNSRAAQLYRDKLLNAAQLSMKVHGTALHIDSSLDHEISKNKEQEDDFFADCSNINIGSNGNDKHNNNLLIGGDEENEAKLSNLLKNDDFLGGAPSVDFLNSSVPIEAPKQTIGVRKIQPKKSGIGARKGLGATKVKTNFADIEQKANMADLIKEKIPEKIVTDEEQAETLASVRLAYQDLSIKQHKEEEKLKATDPNKAKQMERLGMGFNMKSGVSHSAITDMKTISQESASKSSTKTYERDNTDFFDDYSTSMYGRSKMTPSSSIKDFSDAVMMGFDTIEPIDSKQSIQTMFSSSTSNSTLSAANNSSISDQPTYSRGKKSSSNAEFESTDVAQKKFGSAKGISSDQFFDNEISSFERSANLTKFQGSNSISSADYFNQGSSTTSGGTTGSRSRGSVPNLQYNGPDLDDVKESVRQGVTKVAGRLSSMANDVMSSIQDKYGY